MKNMHTFVLLILAYSLQTSLATYLSLEDTDGNIIYAEFINVENNKVNIRLVKNNKTYGIPLSKLNEASRLKVLAAAKANKSKYPELVANITPKTRRTNTRDRKGTSQKVSVTVTLTNKDNKINSPECDCHIIFIGQNQQHVSQFTVLSSQHFTLKPEAGSNSSHTTEPFMTHYFRKHSGVSVSSSHSLKGFKYIGYLLVVTQKNGKVILTKAFGTTVKKATEMNVSLLKSLPTYKVGTRLNMNLKPHQ